MIYLNKKFYKQNNLKVIMQNKRGQGLSTNAIILIVLGVIVLAVLVIGFIVGWEKIAPWMSKDNVGTIVTSCDVACSTNSVYDYCSKSRELKADDLPGNVKSIEGNCTFFSNTAGYGKYGIIACPGLCS
jgi:hypothetical protein